MSYYGQAQPQRFSNHFGNGYHAKPHHQQQQQAPPSYAAPQQPRARLKRQVSEIKSSYPLTKWCAVYVNTKSSGSSNDYADSNLDIETPIPSTNVYLPMDLEQNIIAEVEMFIDEEKETKSQMLKHKQEIQAKKDKLEKEQKDKVDTFMTFTSITDRKRARQLLEENEWNLEQAAAKQFTSSPDIMQQGGGHGHYVNEGGGGGGQVKGSQKAVIRMILPDHREYTFQMDGHDTFWGVYGRLLQSVPELASKAFTLELRSGNHTSVLNEPEFDQQLIDKGMVPRGDIHIKY